MNPAYFFIKDQRRYMRIAYADILYIESQGNYTRVVTKDKVYCSISTLKSWEQMLPAASFLRVYRSFIVALERIDSFTPEEITMGQYRVPVSKDRLPQLLQLVPVLHH